MSSVAPSDPGSIAPLPLFDAARFPLLLNAAPPPPAVMCDAANDRTISGATDAKTTPANSIAERSGAAADKKAAVSVEDARSALPDVRHLIVLLDKSCVGAVLPPNPRICATCGSGSGLRRAETDCPRCRLAARLGDLLRRRVIAGSVGAAAAHSLSAEKTV